MRLNLQTIGEINDPNLFEPRESIAPTAEALIKAREVLGLEPVIGIDYHHRLSVAEAASFCQMMPMHTLDFIEEPIPRRVPRSLRRAAEAHRHPIRNWRGVRVEVAVPALHRKGPDQLRTARYLQRRRFTEAMKVAGWAEAHYIDLMPHNPLGPICVAATSHFATAIPNFSWLEIRHSVGEPDNNFYQDDVFPVQPKVEPGRVVLSDLPGLASKWTRRV